MSGSLDFSHRKYFLGLLDPVAFAFLGGRPLVALVFTSGSLPFRPYSSFLIYTLILGIFFVVILTVGIMARLLLRTESVENAFVAA